MANQSENMGIPTPSLQRLARLAGAITVSKKTYDVLRNEIYDLIEKIISSANIYREYCSRNTLTEDDIRMSLELNNIKMYGEAPDKPCKNYQGLGKSQKKVILTKKGEVRKNGKWKHITKALREIRHYQKQYECYYLYRAPFEKLVRELYNDLSKSSRIEKKAFHTIQECVEVHITNLIRNSTLLMIHANRSTLKPSDVLLSRILSK